MEPEHSHIRETPRENGPEVNVLENRSDRVADIIAVERDEQVSGRDNQRERCTGSRSGRTGQAFTRRGPVNIRNARHIDDPRPLDPDCRCPACAGYARAYLHHLWRAEEILGRMLLTWHNLHYYQELMAGLRAAIAASALDAWTAEFTAGQAMGDIAPL